MGVQRTSAGSAAIGRPDRGDAALRARLRRSGWLLGGLSVAFYLGYLAWIVLLAAS
jgi:hypothetical protein